MLASKQTEYLLLIMNTVTVSEEYQMQAFVIKTDLTLIDLINDTVLQHFLFFCIVFTDRPTERKTNPKNSVVMLTSDLLPLDHLHADQVYINLKAGFMTEIGREHF